jgi:hypothetical protein
VDASTNTIRGERRNIIMVVLCGGLSQLDSFDHKPKAPREMRGVFDACATRTGDAIFSELFPNLAAINDRFLLMRAMRAKEAGSHNRGYEHWLRPSKGTHLITTDLVRSDADGVPYGNIAQPGTKIFDQEHFNHMQPAHAVQITWNTRLAKYEISLATEKEPDEWEIPAARSIKKPIPTNEDTARRLALLQHMDDVDQMPSSTSIDMMKGHYQVAERLILSNSLDTFLHALERRSNVFGENPCGRSFDIAVTLADPEGLNAQIVAIEAGDWDHHSSLPRRMRELAPPFDYALAKLIEHYSDHFDIVVRGEFGRTPTPEKTSSNVPKDGRSHFPVHCGIFAGPTIIPGTYGETNRTGEEIRSGEVNEDQFHRILLEMTGRSTNPGSSSHQFVKR